MGKYHFTIDLLFDWFGISCMTTDNFCFYLENRLIQTSQTGGQRYSDTSPFSIPWLMIWPDLLCLFPAFWKFDTPIVNYHLRFFLLNSIYKCKKQTLKLFIKAVQLKVENSTQTTFRFSSSSFHDPRIRYFFSYLWDLIIQGYFIAGIYVVSHLFFHVRLMVLRVERLTPFKT